MRASFVELLAMLAFPEGVLVRRWPECMEGLSCWRRDNCACRILSQSVACYLTMISLDRAFAAKEVLGLSDKKG